MAGKFKAGLNSTTELLVKLGLFSKTPKFETLVKEKIITNKLKTTSKIGKENFKNFLLEKNLNTKKHKKTQKIDKINNISILKNKGLRVASCGGGITV